MNPFRAPDKIPHHVASRTNPETYDLLFGNHLNTGETLETVVSVTQRKLSGGLMQTSTDLTTGSPSINASAYTPKGYPQQSADTVVQITCKGGTAGYTYELEFLVTTSDGRDITGIMTLEALS